MCISFTNQDDLIGHNVFVDEPDAPEKPVVVDWDRDRIDIEWKTPTNNGGSPITGYVIEKKEKGSPHWQEAGKTSGAQTMFSATGLKEGTEYEFRVVAVNDAGPSDPSDPTDPHKAKPRYCMSISDYHFYRIYVKRILSILVIPKILTPTRKVKVRAGYPLTFPVDFVGEPQPTIDWTVNEKPLPEKLQVDNKENQTSLFFPMAKRGDSGIYHLSLKNELGSDQADFDVIIQGEGWHQSVKVINIVKRQVQG